MGWDELEDLVNVATRDTFGRAVTYTPLAGSPQQLTGIFTPEMQSASPNFDTSFPQLELVESDLEGAGITPNPEGDVVAFVVRGVTRTYRVAEVVRADGGTVLLRLAVKS